jgi:hypothetical protein
MTNVTGASTIYFTPYGGNWIDLYDTQATRWFRHSFSEVSASLAGLTSLLPADVFGYWSAGALTSEIVNWTNGTTRATALVLQDGVRVKSGATDHLYLGTVCGSGSGTCEDSVVRRFVYNHYNQVIKKLTAVDPGTTWVYTTNAYRAMNNSTATRLHLVSGTGEALAEFTCVGQPLATAVGNNVVGIGIDSTTTTTQDNASYQAAANIYAIAIARLATAPPVGYHYYQALEFGCGSGTTTWSAYSLVAGIQGRWRC